MNTEIITNRKIRHEIIKTILWCLLIWLFFGSFLPLVVVWIIFVVLYFILTSRYPKNSNVRFNEVRKVIRHIIFGFSIITFIQPLILAIRSSILYNGYRYYHDPYSFLVISIIIVLIQITCIIVLYRVYVDKYPDEKNDNNNQ